MNDDNIVDGAAVMMVNVGLPMKTYWPQRCVEIPRPLLLVLRWCYVEENMDQRRHGHDVRSVVVGIVYRYPYLCIDLLAVLNVSRVIQCKGIFRNRTQYLRLIPHTTGVEIIG
jgi:hypothetical protein